MMMDCWTVCRSVFLLLLVISSSKATFCFNCYSHHTPECGDHFKIYRSDSHHVSECSGTCVKRRGAETNGQVKRIVIERSCVTLRTEGCYDEVLQGMSYHTCACNTNFCNSSTNVHVSYFFLFFSSLLCYILKS